MEPMQDDTVVDLQIYEKLGVYLKQRTMSNIWRLWAKALGEKASSSDREADKIAWIRTFLILQAVVTNMFIIANALRHWNG